MRTIDRIRVGACESCRQERVLHPVQFPDDEVFLVCDDCNNSTQTQEHNTCR